MSRRDDAQDRRRQPPGQGALLAPSDVVRTVSRVEAAVQRAVEAAASAKQLAAVDEGMAQLAVDLGAAVDVGQRQHDAYAVAAAARELRETLVRLRLDPVSRADQASTELAGLLERLGTPTPGQAQG